jgi:hypothetical protein
MTVGIYPAKNILLTGKPEALEYKNSGAFSFDKGGSMALDMQNIGQAIYESMPH